MGKDLISRKDAIDALSTTHGILYPIRTIEDLPSVRSERKNTKFEESIHNMFDHIWDCEIDHPVFQDTVGDLMKAVIQEFNNIFDNNYCVPLHTDDMRGEQDG